MGVPVVTLLGSRPAGRASASVLTTVGLDSLIAETADQYVHIATQLAMDIDQLVRWRGELRDRLAKTLCDGPAFCRKLEAVYRQVWQTWCRRHPVGLPDVQQEKFSPILTPTKILIRDERNSSI